MSTIKLTSLLWKRANRSHSRDLAPNSPKRKLQNLSSKNAKLLNTNARPLTVPNFEGKLRRSLMMTTFQCFQSINSTLSSTKSPSTTQFGRSSSPMSQQSISQDSSPKIRTTSSISLASARATSASAVTAAAISLATSNSTTNRLKEAFTARTSSSGAPPSTRCFPSTSPITIPSSVTSRPSTYRVYSV